MRTLSKIIIATVLLLSAGNISGQNKFKFGHIDSQGLLQILPDTKTAKDAGKGYLMTLLRSKLLKEVCKDQGYLSMKDGYTNMIKIL